MERLKQGVSQKELHKTGMIFCYQTLETSRTILQVEIKRRTTLCDMTIILLLLTFIS